MPARQRTRVGDLNSGEKRVVYMSQLIDALPKPLPKELLLPVKHMQEMVRHYNGHAALIKRLNEKIESQRKRLAVLEDSGEKIPCAICGMKSCRGIFKVEACPSFSLAHE